MKYTIYQSVERYLEVEADDYDSAMELSDCEAPEAWEIGSIGDSRVTVEVNGLEVEVDE